jgi:hypothetical protein
VQLVEATFGQKYSHVGKKKYYSRIFFILGGHHNLAKVESAN